MAFGSLLQARHEPYELAVELHVEECGSGPPLLLLHGMTGTAGDWRHLFDLDALAATYRLIIPDARGHGRSTGSADEFTFARCSRDVGEILDALGVTDVRAIGLSMGAKTLLHVATTVPGRVAAMVLVSAIPQSPWSSYATGGYDVSYLPKQRSIAFQPDGDLLVVTSDAAYDSTRITRLATDGSADATFASQGYLTVSGGFAWDIALRPAEISWW